MRMIQVSCLILVIAAVVLDFSALVMSKKSSERKKNSGDEQPFYSLQRSQKPVSEVSLSSGLKLSFSDTKSAGTLERWARELDNSGGTVTHHQAVYREQEVVRAVESGLWSPQAFADYQRMAAGTGNVDSARLLLEFGIGTAVMDTVYLKSAVGRLHRAAQQCDLEGFQNVLDEEDVRLDLSTDDGTTPLITASYSGCVNIVAYILQHANSFGGGEGEVDVEATGLHGATALMAASANGHPDVINLLVKKGKANVNTPHKFAGTTALHMAAEMGRATAVIALCNLGADIYAETSTGSTPLHTAAHSGANAETVKALVVDCGSDTSRLMNGDTTPLYLAAQFGHTTTVRALMESGADPGFSMPRTKYRGETFLSHFDKGSDKGAIHSPPLNSEPGNGAQPLHAAAENGHADTVRVMVELGADVNTFTMGVTPLHLAAQYNRLDVAKVLVDMGGKLDLPTYHDGSTALYYASGHGYADMVELLLQAGASVYVKQRRSGGFPLLYASMTGDARIVKMLLAVGAIIDDAGDDGLRPVQAAAAVGSVAIVDILINHQPSEKVRGELPTVRWGADLLIAPGTDGQTPLHVAALNSHNNVIEYLVKAAASQSQPLTSSRSKRASSSSFTSSLFAPSKSSQPDTDTGPFIEMRTTSDGATALHLASMKGNAKGIELLLTTGGANVNARMGGSQSFAATPLYLATKSGSLEAVRRLVAAGADIDAQLVGKVPSTALLAAVEKGDSAIVSFLLNPTQPSKEQREEPINRKNKNTQNNKNAMVEVDVDAVDGGGGGNIVTIKGADPDKGILRGGVMQAPILLAVARGHSQVARLLLQAGASCNLIIAASAEQAKAGGETLADIAQRRRDYDMMQVLASFERCNPEVVRRAAATLAQGSSILYYDMIIGYLYLSCILYS